MSDQPEKQKEITPDEDMKQESAPDIADDPSAPQDDGQQGDGMTQEGRGDLSSELDGILDDADEFQEIDLFDEGVLDEIDQATDSPDTGASDASVAHTAEEISKESAAQRADSDQAADAPADDVAAENRADDDLAQEIAADIAADLGQVDGEQAPEEVVAEDAPGAEEAAAVRPSDGSETAGPEKNEAAGAEVQADDVDGDTTTPVQEDAGPDSSAQVREDQPASDEKIPHVPEQEPDIELEPMEIGSSDPGADVQEGATEGASPSEGQQVPSGSVGNDRDAFGDDLGISLSDDELWDDSGEDDIPLFDDEPDVPEPHGPGARVASAARDASEGQTDGASAETVAGQGADQDHSQGDESMQAGEDEADPEDIIVIGGIGPAWLPYFISGVASIVLLGGIFVLWGMLSSPVVTVAATDTQAVSSNLPSGQQSHEQTARVEKEPVSRAQSKDEVTPVGDVLPIEGRQEVETFDLAPFIIPVMRQGELVFFKLTVELVVPDMQTKQELKKREAWVRDAIYTELKGIDVGPGTKGEFLLNYRRPLKKRIEKELAPLEIRDVRLMGYVLK